MINIPVTTREQAQALMDLGLNPGSADCYWMSLTYKWVLVPHYEPDVIHSLCHTYLRDACEAWSLDALINLMPKDLFTENNAHYELKTNLTDTFWYANMYKNGQMTFITGKDLFEAAYNTVKWLLENNYIKK